MYILRQVDNRYKGLGNVFIIIELLVITIFYWQQVFRKSKYFLALVLVATLGFVWHTLNTSVYSINFLGAGFLCVFYFLIGVAGYYSMLQNPNSIYLNDSPFFWINTAFFLYASSNCLLFMFIAYLRGQSLDTLMSVWGSGFTMINILHYVMIGVGLYKMHRRES